MLGPPPGFYYIPPGFHNVPPGFHYVPPGFGYVPPDVRYTPPGYMFLYYPRDGKRDPDLYYLRLAQEKDNARRMLHIMAARWQNYDYETEQERKKRKQMAEEARRQRRAWNGAKRARADWHAAQRVGPATYGVVGNAPGVYADWFQVYGFNGTRDRAHWNGASGNGAR